jgi:Cdc6-like AAA superfamily ATPase
VINHTPGAIFVCGSPGIGKTATVAEVTANMAQFEQVKTNKRYGVSKLIKINCMELPNGKALYKLIANELALEGEGNTSPEALVEDYLKTKTKRMLYDFRLTSLTT